MLLYISLFIFTSLFFYAVLAFRFEKKAHVQKRVDYYFAEDTPSWGNEAELEEELSFSDRIIKPLWKHFKAGLQKRLNKEKAFQLDLKLAQAGRPFGLSAVEFKILQLVLMIIFPIVAGGYTFLLQLPFHLKMLVCLLSFLGASILPSYYLKLKVKKRSKAALKELPDTLDLITTSLEAGLGFDAALSKMVSKREGVLSDEFKVALEEIRLGNTRKEALIGIRERLPVEELKSVISSIIQAEKLGIGLVSVLRVQTEDIREQRKQKAEEAAMKAPIKMLFPLVVFIFPTLFIILLGPVVLKFVS